MDVYHEFPRYETPRFLLRQIRLADAGDLLRCYNDPEAVSRMNEDDCVSGFACAALSDMEACIRFWLEEYRTGRYLRFALVDKKDSRAFGTMEIFNKGSLGPLSNVGMLRLDLAGAYENEETLTELFSLIHRTLYRPLGLDFMMTKAPRAASIRRELLRAWGYLPVRSKAVVPYEDYWFRWKKTPEEVADSISRCGLVCALCHSAEKCAGCRSPESLCGKRFSQEGCFQEQCTREKGLDGCWECPQGPCGQDMFSEGHDLRNRVFVRVIRQMGKRWLAERLLDNRQFGIQYGWKKDYDGLGSEEAIWELLEK